MPRQARKWTDEQREAMAWAILDAGLNAKEAARRMGAGELRDGLEAFGPPPVSTIRDAASNERRRREGETRSQASKLEPHAALRELFQRVVSILEHGLDSQERAALHGRTDHAKVAAIGKTLRDLIPVAKELDTGARAQPANPDAEPHTHRRTKPRTLADGLLEDARREARAGTPTEGYAHTHIGNADQPGHTHPSSDAAPSTTLGDTDASTDAVLSHAPASGPDQASLRAAEALRARLGTHA